MQQQNNNQNMYDNQGPNGEIPGKNQAVASLVLGIISVVLWFFHLNPRKRDLTED